MIYSMTGFGSSRAEAPNLSVLVEIKSVNHRYLDVHIKIPGEYQTFENLIKQRISGAFRRGRMDAFVRIDYKRENIKLDVNHGLITSCREALRIEEQARHLWRRHAGDGHDYPGFEHFQQRSFQRRSGSDRAKT